jgi:hypothetical protein
MASNILVPLVHGSGPSGASVALVEESWVIPRLVERIQELEEQLHSKPRLEEDQIDNESFTDRFTAALRVAGRSVDAGLAFM